MKFTIDTYWKCAMLNSVFGYTYKNISAATNLKFYTVRAIIRRYRRLETPIPYFDKSKRGKKRISERIKQKIETIQMQNKCFTLNQIRRYLRKSRIKISRSTIHKYRHKLGYKKKKLTSIPILTDAHKIKRKDWCEMMKNENWKLKAFTDESNFEMNYFHKSVWYKNSEDLQEVAANYHQKNEKIMVAGAISWRGKSQLTIWKITNLDPSQDVRVNSVTYKRFLEDIEIDMANLYPFQQVELVLDNAKPHLKFAKNYLTGESLFLRGNYQPPCSPDIQPIELIWAWMKRKVYKENYRNLEELTDLVKKAWNKIPKRLIRKCILHCKKRCIKVSNVAGNWPII